MADRKNSVIMKLIKWKGVFLVIAVLSCVNTQDISCCSKAEGTCRDVCKKMMQKITSNSTVEEDWAPAIYKFCSPSLEPFWECMNQTIEAILWGPTWWSTACCALARSIACKQACDTASTVHDLHGICRRSDEMTFYDCVWKLDKAQVCCSKTHELECHSACRTALWPIGRSRVGLEARDKVMEVCDPTSPLMQCFTQLTTSPIYDDTSKYLPCCNESKSQECQNTCELTLRSTGEADVIGEQLAQDCGEPSIYDEMWQCFLKKDTPESKDVIPHDVAKLHCCQKATTINCRKLCFKTFDRGWRWYDYFLECLVDPQETELAQCDEEVESPCNLGCAGLTYCSHLNYRPTNLFRSCDAQTDFSAHMSVVERLSSRTTFVSGIELPLKNTTQCPKEVWQSVACALHIRPCTSNGHSSLLCAEDCTRVVSSCVEWSKAPPNVTIRSLCARLTPRSDKEPCVSLRQFMYPSPDPPLLSANEAVTSPCSGAPCNSTQVCIVNRNCLHGGTCIRYTCVDGCPAGKGSRLIVPLGSSVRVPMSAPTQRACYKICKCGHRGLGNCQPLPCFKLDDCQLHDKVVPHGTQYYMECNKCTCLWGERICSRRPCGSTSLMTGLPCNCPPHHLPVRALQRLHPNACLAKCAGASDAEIEFGPRSPCATASCPRRYPCLPSTTVCLSRMQTQCPQHVCVNTTSCNSQPAKPVCDTDGRTHANPCHLVMSGRKLAYWGRCLEGCSGYGTVCGVNGVSYNSECAAWAEYISVDYSGPCLAVGPISDLMQPKCTFDRIICPRLKNPNCLGFTAPGACCPKCGGALRILYSKKEVDRAVYGTNMSPEINLSNILQVLERYVKIAECSLRGYLTMEQEIFVTVETLLQNATELQLKVCVLEAEKLSDMINRKSALFASDLGLSALAYAMPVHTYPSNGACVFTLSLCTFLLSLIYVLR